MDPEAGAAPQRRAWSRVPLRAKVRMEFADQRYFLSEWAVNLSPGGMFVRSESPMAPGQRFSFDAALTPKGPRFGGVAEVLWVRRESDRSSRPAGFAVQFLELEEGGRQAIASLAEVFLADGVAAMQEELERLAGDWQERRLDDESTDELPAVEEPLQDTAVIPPPFDQAAEDEDTAQLPSEDVGQAIAAAAEPAAAAVVLEAGEADAAGEEPATAGEAAAPQPVPPPPAPSPAAAGAAREPVAGGRGGWWALALVLIAGGAGYLAWREGARPREGLAGTPQTRLDALVVPASVAAPITLGEPSPSAGGGFESLRNVSWSPAADGLWITLDLDGLLVNGEYAHERVAAAPPEPTRHVFQLRGARRGYHESTLPVELPELDRIRFGYHPEAGNELRVVLDLPSAAVAVQRVENDGSALRILLGPAAEEEGAVAPSVEKARRDAAGEPPAG